MCSSESEVQSAKCFMFYLIIGSRSLAYTIKKRRPNIQPWRTSTEFETQFDALPFKTVR